MTQAAHLRLPGTNSGQPQVPADDHTTRSARLIVSSLFALTKPRIIELLLVTTLPTMLLAQHGFPSAWLMAATLAGGATSTGCAQTPNCFIDRGLGAPVG